MQIKKQNIEFGFEHFAEILSAISQPARLKILGALAERGECICGEIVEVLPLAQSTVSQHLKILKTSGLIKGEVEGTRSCYCLNTEEIEAIRSALDLFFEDLLNKSKQNNCC